MLSYSLLLCIAFLVASSHSSLLHRSILVLPDDAHEKINFYPEMLMAPEGSSKAYLEKVRTTYKRSLIFNTGKASEFADGLLISATEISHVEASMNMRVMVWIEDEDVMNSLDLGPHHIMLFEDADLILDDQFMLALTSRFYLHGTQWAFISPEIEDSELIDKIQAALQRWIASGGWASHHLIKPPEAPLVHYMEPVWTQLLGYVPQNISIFPGYAYRSFNEKREHQTIPGRIDEHSGPAILAMIRDPPGWPHRIAYHGTSNSTDLVRADGWRLKPCSKRCFYGPGVYTSPSFIVAMRNYGGVVEVGERTLKICLQVAVRNFEAYPPTAGATRQDPQWQDYELINPLRPKYDGGAPEFLIKKVEDICVIGIVLIELK